VEPSPATDVAWIALGSNLGHRGRNLARLRSELEARGLVIEAATSEILTRPVGPQRQPDFHNQVVRVRSAVPLPAEEWLRLCKDAEVSAGRKETYRFGPRHADADILLLGPHGEIRVDEPDLVVPHPRLHERAYLQRLLAELAIETDPSA
jgi:2-amino-4-hydroxy-6-hydroxymethyldihydropteridine diphosphokinase